MGDKVVITNCGKLGDFITSLPIISWVSKNINDNIHLVLPRTFALFTKVESLMLMQPMIKEFSLADFPVVDFSCGGQPYKHNPNNYGIQCNKWINLGFRDHPGGKHRSTFMAEEYKLGVDWDFTLDLGNVIPTDEILFSEPAGYMSRYPGALVFDWGSTVLDNARRMKAAKERHCFQSGMCHLLEWADVSPIYVHRVKGHDPIHLYAKDASRFIEIKE